MSFTFSHAMIVSLALHGALVVPFVLPPPEPPEDPQILIVELMGIQAPTQSEEKIREQTKGEQSPQQAQAPAEQSSQTPVQQAPAPEEPREEVSETGTREQTPPPKPEQTQQQDAPSQPSPPPTPASTGNAGNMNVEGVEDQQKAQTLASEQIDETELLRAYLKVLSKKVQGNLVYPEAGRTQGLKGTASVVFTVQPDGAIAPGTLRIATSSGQPKLDAAALKTVDASAPFAVPPRSVTLEIAVVYGEVNSKTRKR